MAKTSKKSCASSKNDAIFLWTDGVKNTAADADGGRRHQPLIAGVKITTFTITVELEDARFIQVPTGGLVGIGWYPFVALKKCRVSDDKKSIEWPDLDYRVSLQQLMAC